MTELEIKKWYLNNSKESVVWLRAHQLDLILQEDAISTDILWLIEADILNHTWPAMWNLTQARVRQHKNYRPWDDELMKAVNEEEFNQP